MSDKFDKLDELFRNKFDEGELPVSDKLLANIKQELNIVEKKKRRFGWWLWMALGAFVVAGVGTYFMINNNTNKTNNVGQVSQQNRNADSLNGIGVLIDENSNQITVNENNANIHKASDATPLGNPEGTVVSEQSEKVGQSEHAFLEEKTETIADKNAVKTQSDKRNIKTVKSEDVSLKSSDNLVKTNKTIKKDKLNKNKVSDAQELHDLKMPANKSAISSSERFSQRQQNNVNIKKDASITAKNTKKAVDEIEKTEEPEIKRTDEFEQRTKIAEKEKTVTTADSTKDDSLALIENKTTADTLKKETKPVLAENNTDPEKTAFFIEVNGGPSVSFRNLSGSNTIVTDRNTHEKSMLTYNAGVDFGIIIKNKFIINTGVGIDNKGEKYNYEGRPAIFTEGLDTTYTLDTNNMDTIMIVTTVSTQTEKAIEAKSAKNKYQFIRIPLMFGYRIAIGEKWFVTPSLGVVINYLISATSVWLDPETKEYVYYNKKDNVFSETSIEGRIKLDLGMNITDKWSVGIQPAYTRSLQSIYRKEDKYQLKLKPYSYDFNIAVRYKF